MRIIIVLVVLLVASTCQALEPANVTYGYNAPGSLKIKYTGVKRSLIDEARDLLEDEWKSDAKDLLNSGTITLHQYRTSMTDLSYVRRQYGLNGIWWHRRWFESLPSNKGGAPRTKRYTVGRTGDIIDFGIARVDENFKFKFKEYSTDITNRWRFRFRPHATGNTKDLISKVSISFLFEYSIRGRKRFRLSVEIGYKVELRDYLELKIEMFNL